MWKYLQLLVTLSLPLTNYSFRSAIEEEGVMNEWIIENCCNFIRNPVCKIDCKNSNQTIIPNESCRRSEELEFFHCLDNRLNSEKCCSWFKNQTCQSICNDLFYDSGSIIKYYNNKFSCFSQMPKCLERFLSVGKIGDFSQYEHCCNLSEKMECTETCRRILRIASSEKEILDTLEDKCGPIMPHSPIWSCFLNLESSELNRIPLDAAKLSCCIKATSSACENSCRRTYYTEWHTSLTQFENECLSTIKENDLRLCLDNTDSTCKFGCSGLAFCSIFNNRPLTLFRSCSETADEAARREFQYWLKGGKIRNLGASLRAAPSCSIELLHLLSCIMHVKPCEPQIHETKLCYQDCLGIIKSCIDWKSIGKNHSAESLCLRFSSPPTNPCISIKSFLGISKEFECSTPLDIDTHRRNLQLHENNPCFKDQLCDSAETCQCQSACKLGEISQQVILAGTWVQVPRFEQQGCYKICQCTQNGFEKCKILNCFILRSCWIHDRFVPHNTIFFLECNRCRCFMGELTCSRRNCGDHRSIVLPCACPAHYVPVCSRLGVTYASSCLSRCAGLTTAEIEFGSCSSKDPCNPSPCNHSERCVRRARVCLSGIHKPCRQYECVPLDCSLVKRDKEPVCDDTNREYESLCSMIKAEGKLGYRGPCRINCSLQEPVCGINGETYLNECAALADNVLVDYVGSCIAFGLQNDQQVHCIDTSIKCQKLLIPNCLPVTPPGACCPICAGAARLYYSRKQLDRILYMIDKEDDKDAVTLKVMLESLSQQIQVESCSLRGMVTFEGDIFVLLVPNVQQPKKLHLIICRLEIERLSTMISQKNPTIMMRVPMSALTGADVVHIQMRNIAFYTKMPLWLILSFLLLHLFNFISRILSCDFT